MNVLPKLTHIGHWNTNVPTTTSLGAIALSEQPNMGPTGPDIQTEEENVGSTFPRASYHVSLLERSNALLENSNNETFITGATDLNMPSEYRKFEWYWVLILIMLFSVSTIVLYTFAHFGQIIGSFRGILAGVVVTVSLCFGYSSTFVILTLFHEAIESSSRNATDHTKNSYLVLASNCSWCCGYGMPYPPFLGLITRPRP